MSTEPFTEPLTQPHRDEEAWRAALTEFRAALAIWVPAPEVGADFATWTLAADGSVSIRLPGTLAANLGAEFDYWDTFPSETHECLLGVMKAQLGRHFVNALIIWARNDRLTRPENAP